MLCIQLENSNPYFCLAAEEYLLKNFSEDIFMLWQSHDTVVVGKHQNALAEINYPFVRENNITVARRISGGGTVFHDAGNVNFAYIKNVNDTAEINFKKFTKPVVEALERLGINAVNSGRNDLLVNDKKISGNAEHVFKKRVLHHGTLLFDSDLSTLGHSIKVAPGKYSGKAVQSNRSFVANIQPFLKEKITTEEFRRFLLYIQLEHDENSVYELNEKDNQAIEKLANEKFKTWAWNFGYSPKYAFQNETKWGDRTLNISLNAEKGWIAEATISGDFFSARKAELLNQKLPGKRHYFEDIKELLEEIQPGIPDELVFAFF
jgi:lipoate-protein ligase A